MHNSEYMTGFCLRYLLLFEDLTNERISSSNNGGDSTLFTMDNGVAAGVYNDGLNISLGGGRSCNNMMKFIRHK